MIWPMLMPPKRHSAKGRAAKMASAVPVVHAEDDRGVAVLPIFDGMNVSGFLTCVVLFDHGKLAVQC
jgi:hypothetical protein